MNISLLNQVEHPDSYKIACQTRVLVWISFSYFNFYSLIGLVFGINSLSGYDIPKILTRRFKVTVLLAFFLVPFMFSWNMYGNFMIKQEYFRNVKA